MKILNLYAGIGGNRKLWGEDHEITAVEYKPEIAKIYQDFFPNDKVIIADAHEYLLEHFAEFDFIWSSPPCPSHSRIRRWTAVERGQNKPIYPNMKLYEEIIFLSSYFKGKYCVENVLPYYEPLIPAQKIGSHLFWMNFLTSSIGGEEDRKHNAVNKVLEERKGFDLSGYKNLGIDKKLILRNCVEPLIGKKILDCAINSPSLFKEEPIRGNPLL